jgi:DNA-binding LytR/AlgR family response regulator
VTRPSALVAEDEAPQRRKLCELLGELWPELEIVAECGDGLTALEALTTLHPQIAFLDIRMPGVSGLEVARAASAEAHVVFTTAYDEYAVSAFDQGALDYVLKPIRRERLERTVLRLKERIGVTAPPGIEHLLDALQGRVGGKPGTLRWITGSAGLTTKMFGIDEVLFFQAQDKYVRVVTATDEVQIRTPLRELLGTLDPDTFWQIHRSVIVRAGAIRKLEANADGKLQLHVKGRVEILPVSSAFHHRFKPM